MKGIIKVKIYLKVKAIIIGLLVLGAFIMLTACSGKNTEDQETINIEGDGRNGITRGMSPEEVRQCKGKKGIRVGEALFYKNDVLPCIKDVVVLNYKCSSGYLFSGEGYSLKYIQ